MNEIKIQPIYPTAHDATSYYRGAMPINEMFHRYPLGLIMTPNISWDTMSMCDVVFLQRPFTPDHVKIAEMAHKLGKAVWCDWDDDLFTVPEDNPAHQLYQNKDYRLAVATLAARADAVTVSTPVLKKRYDDLRFRADKTESVVIPNALSNHLLKRRLPRVDDGKRRKVIFWRGSQTHMNDLMTMDQPIIDLMTKNDDFVIHFLGYNPFWITRNIRRDRCVSLGNLDILDYHTHLQEVQPSIVIVPLHDSQFNRGKSNIAWIEGTYGHAQVVAPDFPEWQRPGILTYRDADSFKVAVETAIHDVREHKWDKVDESWKYIEKNLLLSQTNSQRWEILKKLVPHKPQSGEEKGEPYYRLMPGRQID